MVLVLVLVAVNVVSLVPGVFGGGNLSLQEAVRVFQEVTERAWSRTDQSFASAQRARSISPVLSYPVTLFALLFTPPPTRWLGLQEFRVIGALLFYFAFAYATLGSVWMVQNGRHRYWPLLAVALLIPLMLANVPTLVGSRHRFQIEPIFYLVASFGIVEGKSKYKHVYALLMVLVIILITSAVDVLF